MIKVNLLHNMGLASAAAAGDGFAASPETLRTTVAKVITILVFPILLYIYERVNISEIEDGLRRVQEKVQAVKSERSKFGDAGPKVELYNKEKARIDKELEILRSISRNRLREVKALDAIQSLMPPKCWAKKISIEGNLIVMDGYTTSNDGVSELIRSLEANIYFSKVEPKFTEQETWASGSVKKFELEFRIGKQDARIE